MKVLITGGAGYIGSTICCALEDKGHTPVILDSLVMGRLEYTRNRIFYKGDICDNNLLDQIFEDHKDIECVIHCAALIVVPDSMKDPYEYYKENVNKSIGLFKKLEELGCKKIVFSSSASVYDDVDDFEVKEDSPLNPRSPYARSKYMIEMVLEDYCRAYGIKGISLRYFNVIGAEPQMRTGGYLKSPSHVLAKLLNVANGIEDVFKVTGVNWPTRDGSGLRDYIHVWDLAQAHVCALEEMDQVFSNKNDNTYMPINLGTGKGVTVREMLAAFERVHGPINQRDTEPRPGDIPGAFANVDRAKDLIKWTSHLSIEQGIQHALDWDKIRESKIEIL